MSERDPELLAREVVDAAVRLHQSLGPGLLESVYELLLQDALRSRGIEASRQHPVTFEFRGRVFSDGFRVDLLVEDVLVIELKSVERLIAVHHKQLLTYLRLLHLPLGLLLNFGGALMKDGIHRIVNDHRASSASLLRIHQSNRPPRP